MGRMDYQVCHKGAGNRKMTLEEYYEKLKNLWAHVDKDNLEEIKRYNEIRREMRRTVTDDNK